MKFDLGGIGKNSQYKTVNLGANADIKEDITELDNFCEDNSVEEFYLSHTLEHIHVTKYKKFLLDMKRKLIIGGKIKVVQTDVGRLIQAWADGKISFRTMRAPIFTPASRCSSNLLQQHQSMWSEEELIKDFESIGMKASRFDAGTWSYDLEDDIIPLETVKDFGFKIPNLGIISIK